MTPGLVVVGVGTDVEFVRRRYARKQARIALIASKPRWAQCCHTVLGLPHSKTSGTIIACATSQVNLCCHHFMREKKEVARSCAICRRTTRMLSGERPMPRPDEGFQT